MPVRFVYIKSGGGYGVGDVSEYRKKEIIFSKIDWDSRELLGYIVGYKY